MYWYVEGVMPRRNRHRISLFHIKFSSFCLLESRRSPAGLYPAFVAL